MTAPVRTFLPVNCYYHFSLDYSDSQPTYNSEDNSKLNYDSWKFKTLEEKNETLFDSTRKVGWKSAREKWRRGSKRLFSGIGNIPRRHYGSFLCIQWFSSLSCPAKSHCCTRSLSHVFPVHSSKGIPSSHILDYRALLVLHTYNWGILCSFSSLLHFCNASFPFHVLLFILLFVELVIILNTLKKFYVDPGCMTRVTVCATPFRQRSHYYSRNFNVEFEAALYQTLTREIAMSLQAWR